MTNSQFWCDYERTQKQLASGATVDDRAWGLEAALNELLRSGDDPNGNLRKAIQSGARGERRRSQILRRYPRVVASPTSPGLDARLDARRQLLAVKAQVPEADWAVLQRLGEGFDYAHIAALHGGSAAGIRVRVHRLRRSLQRSQQRPPGLDLVDWPSEIATTRPNLSGLVPRASDRSDAAKR